mmetsp:Transcript_10188/g.8995  ORF Transcript_10188/g.8995 Transcript_10188/m.8995 type:complete len:85 (-) Transcript_10188:553-807(-)
MFTTLNMNKKCYTVNKILLREEIEYFTLPYLRQKLNFSEGLDKYIVEYLTTIIKVARFSNNSKTTQSLFEPDRKYTSVVGGEAQ